VTVVEAPEGKDFAIEVELVRPLGDDYAQLAARSTIRLADYGLRRRLWSWAGILVVLGLFLAAPIVFYYQHTETAAEKTVGARADSVWDSGPISSAHKFISDQCNICHEKPFVQVMDGACASCHESTRHHFDAAKTELAGISGFRNMTAQSCNSCHREHNGDQAISIRKESFCIDCHKDTEKTVAALDLKNADSFDKGHPEFRPSVIADSVSRQTKRISLDEPAALIENSGLKFPHELHLKQEGVRGPKGKETLDCNGCHQLTRGAANFDPIGMEGACERCHQLVFDPRRPDRTLPHGQVQNAQMLIREFYSDYGLRGGINDVQDPAAMSDRRRPGEQTDITTQRQTNPRDWADQQAQRVADQAFGKTMCGKCHEVSTGPGKGPLNWAVVPAFVNKNWLPRGRFDHSAHADMLKCDSCHAAKTSKKASDVLLPRIAVCKDCHGGENASNKVPSTCITCHDFHLPGGPLMVPVKNAGWDGPDVEVPGSKAVTQQAGK
ncbi:MAG: cytochrome c3 family protein, partial [Alphaproteobacteria bacterium]